MLGKCQANAAVQTRLPVNILGVGGVVHRPAVGVQRGAVGGRPGLLATLAALALAGVEVLQDSGIQIKKGGPSNRERVVAFGSLEL